MNQSIGFARTPLRRKLVLVPLALIVVTASVPARAAPAFVISEFQNPEPAANARFGGRVAGLGDLNGDGVGDLAVASIASGVVWVISGTNGSPIFRLTDPDDLTDSPCEPTAASVNPCNFGYAIANVFDIDGDGTDDFAVGAPGALAGTEIPCVPRHNPPPPPGEPPLPPIEDKCPLGLGRVIVYSGATGTVLRNIPHWPGTPPKIGVSLLGLGDVNGDGMPEISIGHPGNAASGGAVSLTSLSADSGIFWWTASPNLGMGFLDNFGVFQASLGDLTGDGWPEILVTAIRKVYVLSGIDGEVLRIHEDPHEHEMFSKPNFGYEIAALGDLDSDTTSVYVVGEPGDPASEESLLHLFDGTSGDLLASLPSPLDARGVSLAVVSTGDYDDDEVPDLWLGSFFANAATLMTATGATIATLTGPEPDSSFGSDVVAVAPLLPGPPDLLVSASGRTVAGFPAAGSVYVVRRDRKPVCSGAVVNPTDIWAPNLAFVPVTISGVTDPEGGPISINVTSIRQDEPVGTAPDGLGVGTSTASVRAQRSGTGDGRVYHVAFEASDSAGGTCSATVLIRVAHDLGGTPAVDGGPLYDSTAM